MGAAALWGLLRPAAGPVDVSAPTQNGRRGRPGIRLHRRRSLPPDQTTSRKGIPVTTPARTIEDLRGTVPPPQLRRAIRQAELAVGGWTVDFLWRAEGVAVDTDFYGYHRGRVAFRDDRARDLALRRRGFAVHRFSEEQIDERPAEVAADLRDALALAS
jgi:hypothetical protein